MGRLLPGWLGGLLVEESFFLGCGTHPDKRKNEKNIFCLDCCTSICPQCAPTHSSHPLLQVRRYMYNDVVRLDDLKKLIDCSSVQSYTINGAKVVFLKQRPNARPPRGSGNVCPTCHRLLQEPFRFCSLSCKVNHVAVLQGEDISSILFQFNKTDFSFLQLRMEVGNDLLHEDEGEVMEEEALQHEGCSSTGSRGMVGRNEAVKRKKKGNNLFPQIALSFNNRRKGSPRRAPLS